MEEFGRMVGTGVIDHFLKCCFVVQECKNIVNQEGVVYEKNLGEDTEKIAAAMKKYDPDKTGRN